MDDDEEDSTTKIISSKTAFGEMADILKACPFLTVEDYLWKYSSAFIRLMAIDQSRIKILKDKNDKKDGKKKTKTGKNAGGTKAFSPDDVFNSLGFGNHVQGNMTDLRRASENAARIKKQSKSRK